MPLRHPLRLPIALAVCLIVAPPTTAQAHTPTSSTSPRANATTSTSLKTVRVTFESRIASGTLRVRRAGRVISVGRAARIDGRTALRVRLRSGLRAGRCSATVRWLSTDGHPQSRTWRFKLR